MPVLVLLPGLFLALHPSAHVPLRTRLRGTATTSMVAIDVTQLDRAGRDEPHGRGVSRGSSGRLHLLELHARGQLGGEGAHSVFCRGALSG